MSSLNVKFAGWRGGWRAVLENQSHTVIRTGNEEDSQPQQKDRNKNKMSESREKFNYTKGVLHNKNILLLDN